MTPRYALHSFGPFTGIQDRQRTNYHVCGRMAKPRHPHRRSYTAEEMCHLVEWLNDRAAGYPIRGHLVPRKDYLQLGAERVEDLR